VVWCGSLPAVSRKGDGCRTPRVPKWTRGKRRPTQRCRRRRRHAAAGEDRTLEVVLARHAIIVAEVDRQCQAQRSGRSSISPDLEAFRDGRLAGGHTRESAGCPAAKRRWYSTGAEGHVTVSLDGVRPAQGAGGWRWKASRIVGAGESSRNACRNDLGSPGGIEPRVKRGKGVGARQGCQRSGDVRSEWRKTPRANLESPAEADRAP